jgi:hypothetical protein
MGCSSSAVPESLRPAKGVCGYTAPADRMRSLSLSAKGYPLTWRSDMSVVRSSKFKDGIEIFAFWQVDLHSIADDQSQRRSVTMLPGVSYLSCTDPGLSLGSARKLKQDLSCPVKSSIATKTVIGWLAEGDPT